MIEIKWDIKRGAQIYRQVYDRRLKNWISSGKIKQGEIVVWRSGFSGWRRPEDLEEFKPYFKRWERSQLKSEKRHARVKGPLLEKREIKNILIIDDEKDLCHLLADILRHRGYGVSMAHTLKDSLAFLKKGISPDLIFLDLKLPDGNGIKMISKIKKIAPQTLVNIISAYGSQEMKEEAKSKGVFNFIDKPFTETAILRTIKSVS